MIRKVENIVPWTYIISDLNGKEIDTTFYKKELRKTNLKEFLKEEKVINYICYLIVGLIKKLLRKMTYLPEPIYSETKIKFELHLSNYVTKTDLKRARGVNTSDFAKNAYLTCLKLEVCK